MSAQIAKKCQFTTSYYNYEKHEDDTWECEEESADTFCVFHSDTNNQWNEKVWERFNSKIKESTKQSKPLFCMGYHFPEYISIKDTFTRPVYLSKCKFNAADFSNSNFKDWVDFSSSKFKEGVKFRKTNFKAARFRDVKFYGVVNFRWAEFDKAYFHDTLFEDKANFRDVTFKERVRFHDTKFQYKANFNRTIFKGRNDFYGTTFQEARFDDTHFENLTNFNYVVFENGEKIVFKPNSKDGLSKVSFMNTDVTRVKFDENVIWNKERKEKFKILDERELVRKIDQLQTFADPETKEGVITESKEKIDPISIGPVKAIYRNLRENHEFRLRYDEAGEFFIREMELKRKYREEISDSGYKIKENNIVRRNLSLTGIYFRLFGYGEKLRNIAITVGIFFVLSTLYWVFFIPTLPRQGLAQKS